MITFSICILCLILGYIFYGKFIAKLFGINPAGETPSARLTDGVDYVELPAWRIFMIQLLNIAGLGPIFGAILGAAYGPIAYVWIVLGCIFMGAVHDFFSGAISMRNNGYSLPNLIADFLGPRTRVILAVLSGIMLLAVGVAFVNGPAGLLSAQSAQLAEAADTAVIDETGLHLPFASVSWTLFWTTAIIIYYALAVVLPINKIIGKIYPIFAVALVFMAVGVGGAMLWLDLSGAISMQELTPDNWKSFQPDPASSPIFPVLFVVISCGAISGFHATQSPMMARCLGNEKYARPIFFGAMIAEGIIALIWAAAAIAYCGGAEAMNAAGKPPAVLVNSICTSWLGTVGAVAAILGVIVCPITSGDTALRSVRLIIAEAFHIEQKSLRNRILVAIPIFAVALILSQIRFEIIWRYIGLANQTLAAITLWACATWLAQERKPHWFLSLPATFLSGICTTYFLFAPHRAGGLALPYAPSCIVGAICAFGALTFFIKKTSSYYSK